MKLLYCPLCQDIFKLSSHHTRTCFCGITRGRYERGSGHAIVNGKGISVAIANLDLSSAVARVKDGKGNTAVRCWVRPNEGNHNPRTVVQEDM